MDQAIQEFLRLYYKHACPGDHGDGLHSQTRYHGIETHKCPLDLWVFQEILTEIRPGLVIELGTYLGGSTLFLAHQLELLGEGQVISIDNRELNRPQHERITYLLGNTTDTEILNQVQSIAKSHLNKPVIVIHDADHRYDQVLEDLEAYAPFVTPGSYLKRSRG